MSHVIVIRRTLAVQKAPSAKRCVRPVDVHCWLPICGLLGPKLTERQTVRPNGSFLRTIHRGIRENAGAKRCIKAYRDYLLRPFVHLVESTERQKGALRRVWHEVVRHDTVISESTERHKSRVQFSPHANSARLSKTCRNINTTTSGHEGSKNRIACDILNNPQDRHHEVH